MRGRKDLLVKDQHKLSTPGQHRKPEKRKLTDRVIRAIEPGKDAPLWVYDIEVPYLGVRTMPSGIKSFTYGYRNHAGRLHRVTLGRFPALTATAARIRAREIAAAVAVGKDPYEEEQERRGAITLAAMVDQYAERHLATRRQGKETERYLRRYAIPGLGAKTKAADVKRCDVIQLVEEKAATAPIAANRLLSAIRRMFNWGLRRDLVPANPCALVQPPTIEQARDRTLGEDEIRTLWNSLPAQRMTESTRNALRVVLLTAQRPGEVCAMKWSELDLARNWWELSRQKTKNVRAHRVPLTPMVLELLETQPKGDPWVFPSLNDQPLKPSTLSHAVRRNKSLGLKQWTPHDLRRTAASHMAAAGVDRFTIERVLNHTDSTVGGIYDRYGYDKEKRTALERWERRLRSIIGEPVESKIVEIG